MPELPEVETVKNVLKPIVINQTINKIDVLRATTIVGNKEEFVKNLEGKTFTDITRIGKFLIFHLSDNKAFISHLRMEGKYFEIDENDANTKYARVVFHLNNQKKICYDDSRCFGIMILSDETNYKNVKDIASLGPEPFAIEDVSYLKEKTKKSTLPIKSTLLDQTLMTGLGNIYADEVLFASKIHPLTEAKNITTKQWSTIVENTKNILNKAIELGGSTIRSYHPGKDIDGNFQTRLLAYGKANTPCPNCGHLMRFIKVGGRGTTFCPICQTAKSDKIAVAIYGKIASGKSTALKIFAEKGFPVISADEIVSDLYKDKVVINKINDLFSLSFVGSVDKNVLRNYLISHPKDINKLNRLIHPLVKARLIDFIKKAPNGLLICEVPLLYESKCESLFDYIIAININDKEQNKRLALRNPSSNKELAIINANHQFNINKEKADIVIDNSSAPSNLKRQINELIDKLQDRLN